MRRSIILLVGLVGAVCQVGADAEEAALRKEAAGALRKATDFFVDRVSTEGGYLWRYSEDLSEREGEGTATDTMVWIQPPGTPSVGRALLRAYHDTDDRYYLEAARQAGYCLVRGQLRSGGWDYRIDFSPEGRRRYAYRVDAPVEGRSQRNTSTLDDNTTQAALRLLMDLDETLEFKDAKIHEAARFGLDTLVEVQYPIGAWPQRFEGAADPQEYPVKRASYPESWSWTYPGKDYRGYYTFNDNAMADVVDVMFQAARVYDDRRYSRAAEKAGGFMLLAQMPEPQPAWAQQYDPQMQPSWARKFEPPSITGGESQGVMRTLLRIYRETGEKKYLEPIPRALAYFRRSLLSDGRLARFYELKTNRPLYFTREEYDLTYSDADMPTHYSFQHGQTLDAIERAYRELVELSPQELKSERRSGRPSRASGRMIAGVEAVIGSLDEQGRWVGSGTMRNAPPDSPSREVIDCRTFIANVGILSRYLATASD